MVTIGELCGTNSVNKGNNARLLERWRGRFERSVLAGASLVSGDHNNVMSAMETLRYNDRALSPVEPIYFGAIDKTSGVRWRHNSASHGTKLRRYHTYLERAQAY
jgi:hypothetical protein